MTKDRDIERDDLITFLNGAGADFRVISHDPCRSAAESTEARTVAGWPDSLGAEALVVKSRRGFATLVLPDYSRFDKKAIRQKIGRFSLASDRDLLTFTNLEYGMVAPILPTIVSGD